MAKRKSKLSLVAMILGIICISIMIALIKQNTGSTTDSAEALGSMIGLGIVLPSVGSMAVAVILNIIGYFSNARVITLISGIFYALSLVLMPLWGFIGIPSMILQFIAFKKMKNIS